MQAKIDVLPPSAGAMNLASDFEARLQRQRQWVVLLCSFVLTLVIGLLFVWLRSPIYQSQAILHFSYPQPLAGELQSVSDEQITIHAQRMVSNRILQRVQTDLAARYGISMDQESLAAMLRAEPVTMSRLITLSATGTDTDILLPTLTIWIEAYLQLRDSEQADDVTEEITAVEEKIAALAQRILEMRQKLTHFGAEHQIVSLERDENRALNNIKGMSQSLDAAIEEQANAAAMLNSVRSAMLEGNVSVRPQDQSSVDNMEGSALRLEEELRQYSERYTDEYMTLDPKIVALQRNLDSAREQLSERRVESQGTYLKELEQALVASRHKEANLKRQLQGLEVQAQGFNSKLVEYRAMDQELVDLELQSQLLKTQRVELEVQRPYEARIDLLEEPFAPDFPIGPHYWRDTGFAVIAAALMSLLMLVVFSAIQGNRNTGLIIAPFSVNATPPNEMLTQRVAPALARSESPQLAQLVARQLSDEELAALYRHANSDGKRVLGLLLSGVAPAELEALTTAAIDEQNAILHLGGQFARTLPLLNEVLSRLVELAVHLPEGASLWRTPDGRPLTLGDLRTLPQQAAIDAKLEHAVEVSVEAIRHSYLAYLVGQGGRLNELEMLVGYLSPSELTQLRPYGEGVAAEPVEHVETRYPLPGDAV